MRLVCSWQPGIIVMFRPLFWLGLNDLHSQAKVSTNALRIPEPTWQMKSPPEFVRSSVATLDHP